MNDCQINIMKREHIQPIPSEKTQDTALSSLAKQLGVSRATVSKTIRHCSGVDTETRETILRAAKKHPACMTGNRGSCDIYCILPDTPSFFWKAMQAGIKDGIAANAADISVKYNLCTKLHDEETVLCYLEEAQNMQARCIIITAAITDAIRAKLAEICRSQNCMVLLLSEYGEIPNSFYIGADAYTDGAEMARRYIQLFCAYSKEISNMPIILTYEQNRNVADRVSGFCDTISTAYLSEQIKPQLLPLDAHIFQNPKLLPSSLASVLSVYAAKNSASQKQVLYAPVGIFGFFVALHKAGFPEDTICFCHDMTLSSDLENTSAKGFSCKVDRNIRPLCLCMQDITAQGTMAFRCAADFIRSSIYPAQKKILIPSKFQTLWRAYDLEDFSKGIQKNGN